MLNFEIMTNLVLETFDFAFSLIWTLINWQERSLDFESLSFEASLLDYLRKLLADPAFAADFQSCVDIYKQLRLVLLTENKENYLEHPIPAAPVALPGQQVPPKALAAHVAWVKGQKEVVVLMLFTMDLEVQRNLAHLGAYDMLQELKALYSKQVEQELLQTVREFHTCKQEEGQSVSSHVLKIKGYTHNLE
nr:zinc finger, CCHC-type [Tanacetum cinerariifolium]